MFVRFCTLFQVRFCEQISRFPLVFVNIGMGFSDNKMYKMRRPFNVIQEFIAHGILAFDFHFFLW